MDLAFFEDELFKTLTSRAGAGGGCASRYAARVFLALAIVLLPLAASATSVIPISDAELSRRADVIVRGVVVSNAVGEDVWGRPETVSQIVPIEILKGTVAGRLVLHQAGGVLADGRFFHLWGRPEYEVGTEVIVFAIARPEGDFQTAELLLGKFQVWQDASGRAFALPELATGHHPNVTVGREREERGGPRSEERYSASPRELRGFASYLRGGAVSSLDPSPAPVGALAPVRHKDVTADRLVPQWGNIGGNRWRWNPPTAAWQLEGTANMAGGGVSEALGALASWTDDSNSTIAFTAGTATSKMYLNALSSPCGWSTCVSGSGVVGCGGPRGGGNHTWRGESYATITWGEVWLRSYCSFNGFSSVITESILLHELGHALGLGHSDTDVSSHDVCRGDESAASMRSTVQNRRTLGTDDQDAIRWLYGDGSNSCAPVQPAPVVTSVYPSFGSTAGGSVVTIRGTNFQPGTSVKFDGIPASTVTFVDSTTLTATTPSHSTGVVNVTDTNPDSQSGTLVNGFTYGIGSFFYTVAPCRLVDTRNPAGPRGGPALGAFEERSFPVTGACGIPATAKALSLNVTATEPSVAGYIRLFPGSSPAPSASVVNYAAGLTRANNNLAGLGPNGEIRVRCDQPSGSVHVIIDANGYFE